MLTNNIVVLDPYFNLTNKSDLIDRLLCDLIRFFVQLVVVYFLGPPCILFFLTYFLTDCLLTCRRRPDVAHRGE